MEVSKSVKEKAGLIKKLFSFFYKISKSKFLSVLEILLKFCQTLLCKDQSENSGY